MTDQRDKETIFGMPVESLGRRDADDEGTRGPVLGWSLTILLLVTLAVNLFDIVYTYKTGEFGIYLLGAEIPRLWSFLILHTSPILRVIAVFGILRTKYWGVSFYLAATFFFLLFCTVPEFNVPIFSMHAALLVAWIVLIRGKWTLFD